MLINSMMPSSKNQNIGMVRIGNCDCRIDSGGNCVDSVISQKSSLKIKKYWTHHNGFLQNDVSNFFMKVFAELFSKSDKSRPQRPQRPRSRQAVFQ